MSVIIITIIIKYVTIIISLVTHYLFIVSYNSNRGLMVPNKYIYIFFFSLYLHFYNKL